MAVFSERMLSSSFNLGFSLAGANEGADFNERILFPYFISADFGSDQTSWSVCVEKTLCKIAQRGWQRFQNEYIRRLYSDVMSCHFISLPKCNFKC